MIYKKIVKSLESIYKTKSFKISGEENLRPSAMMRVRLQKSPILLIKSQKNLVTMIFVHSWAKRTRIFMMLLKWQMHYSPR